MLRLDLFQDIAQSLGVRGQPNHPNVTEFQARVTEAAHAAGKKTAADVMDDARATNLFLEGARAFLDARKSE